MMDNMFIFLILLVLGWNRLVGEGGEGGWEESEKEIGKEKYFFFLKKIV